MIGNSSSGILGSLLLKPTINIGDRQKRVKSKVLLTVCRINSHDAIKLSQSKNFQKICANSINPYGEKGAPDKIVKILENTDYTDLLKKEFYDLSPQKQS